MELAYVAHSARCALLLDADGVCRWVVPKADASDALVIAARRCVGGQFVAALDREAEGLLSAKPRVGTNLLFACSNDGRLSLARFGPIVEFEMLDTPVMVTAPPVAEVFDPAEQLPPEVLAAAGVSPADRPTATSDQVADLLVDDERGPITRRIDPSMLMAADSLPPPVELDLEDILEAPVANKSPDDSISTPALAKILEPSSHQIVPDNDMDATGHFVQGSLTPATLKDGDVDQELATGEHPTLSPEDFSEALDSIFTDENNAVTRATDREMFFSSEDARTPEANFGRISSPAVASFLKEVSDLADTPFSQDWARLDNEIALALTRGGSAPALEEILSEANDRLSAQQRAVEEARAARREDSEVEIMTGSFARLSRQDAAEESAEGERSHRTEMVPAARASYGDLVEDALENLVSPPPPPAIEVEPEPLPPSRPHRPSGFIIRKIKPAVPTLPGLQPAAAMIHPSDDGEETCRFARASAARTGTTGGPALGIEEMPRTPTSRRGVLPTTTARLR